MDRDRVCSGLSQIRTGGRSSPAFELCFALYSNCLLAFLRAFRFPGRFMTFRLHRYLSGTGGGLENT